MENAGRILLMPKGDYSASTTYAMLDIVNHSGASWVCKQACKGQTPSDSNTTYWQRVGTAVDMSKYLSLDGGTLTRTARKILILDNTHENGTGVSIGYSVKGTSIGELGVSADKVPFYNNGTTEYGLLHTGNFSTYALSKSGGTLKSATPHVLTVENSSGDLILPIYRGTSGTLGYLGFDGENKPVYGSSIGSLKTLLHTGNKPTGSYTGNGSATERTINTGGIGNTLIVGNQNNSILVTPNGAFGKKGTSFMALNNSNANFAEGVLTLSTDDPALNYNGYAYYYQVL